MEDAAWALHERLRDRYIPGAPRCASESPSGPGYIDGSFSCHAFRLPILLPTPRVTRQPARAPPH